MKFPSHEPKYLFTSLLTILFAYDMLPTKGSYSVCLQYTFHLDLVQSNSRQLYLSRNDKKYYT